MRIALMVGALALAGCGPRLEMASDACWMWGATLCDRAAACELPAGDPPGACRSSFVESCCRGSDCRAPLTKAQVEIALDCDYAFRQMTCGQLAAGTFPTGCGG